MKKLFLVMLFGSILMAEPYLRIGGSFSDAPSNTVHCRISSINIVGYDTGYFISPELWYSKGLAGDYEAYDLLAKIDWHSVSWFTIGYGVEDLKRDKRYKGISWGSGVDLDHIGLKNFNIDFIYRFGEHNKAFTVTYDYEF